MHAPSAPEAPARGRLELFYRIALLAKGLDGLLELLAGLALWLAPCLLARLLVPLERTDLDDRALRILLAEWAGRLDASLSTGSNLVVIIFLLSHGVVKVLLVYCLLREYRWVFPYAVGVLGLSALYQTYVLLRQPGIWMLLLTLLDLLILWLVWRDWRSVPASTEEVGGRTEE